MGIGNGFILQFLLGVYRIVSPDFFPAADT